MSDWLDWQPNPLSLPRIATLMTQVLDAVSHAHHLGIVHQSIHPRNFFITQDEQILVINFGLTELITTCVELTGMVLRPDALYSSPEQLSMETAIDHRSDLYVLGVVLYRLLTGQDLFLGHASFDIVMQHIIQAPIPPQIFHTPFA